MTQIKRIRWVSGLTAAMIFAAMVVILKTCFERDLLFPQQTLTPYPEIALAQFAVDLGDSLALYRNLILYMDSSFLAGFGLWVISSFAGRASMKIAVPLAALTVGTDILENVMITARMGIAPIGNMTEDMLLADPSPTMWVTRLKFTFFAITLLAIALLWSRDRRI
jgi:hypothetical protein